MRKRLKQVGIKEAITIVLSLLAGYIYPLAGLIAWIALKIFKKAPRQGFAALTGAVVSLGIYVVWSIMVLHP